MEKYDIMSVVGEGSYGIVMKCRHRESGQYVAIKKFLETEDDLNVRKMALREIRMLKKLRHENLVNMIEVFRRKKRFFLVFEYLEHTILEELETRSGGLGFVTSRKYIYQVLRALDFIHSNNVIHRDIKPENVLVSRSGVIKLCDFGFARPFADNETFTDYVATRWYRSPELLVGDPRYGKEVDIWAVGCLYSEMMTGDPLFPGESDIDQLFQIVRILGKLNSRHQILVTRNTMFKGMKQEQNSSLSQLFPDWNRDCLEFLTKCLRMDGNLRPDTSILLKHELFMKDDFLDNFLPELRTKINQEMQRNPLLTRVNGFGSGRKQVEEKKQVQPEKPPPPAVGPKKSLEDSKPLQLNSKERITQIGLSLFPATQPTNHFKLTTGGVEEFNLNLTSYKHYLSQKTNGNNINGNNNNVKPINLTFKETGKYSRVLSAKPQRTNIIDKNQQTTIQQNSEHQLQSSPVQFQSLQTDGSQGQTEKLSPMNVNNLTISGNISQYFNNKRSTNILGLQKVVNNNNNNNKQSPTPLNFVTRNNLVKRDRGVLLDVGLTPYGFSGLTTAGGTTTGTINNEPSKEASPRLPPPQWLTGNLKVSSQGKTTQIGKRGITDWKTISNNNNKTIGDGNDFVLPNCPGASISPYKGLKKKLTPMATISHDMTPRIQSPPPKTHESTS